MTDTPQEIAVSQEDFEAIMDRLEQGPLNMTGSSWRDNLDDARLKELRDQFIVPVIEVWAARHRIASTRTPPDGETIPNARYLLDRLARAEANYRYAHDHYGSADIRTGRSWDKMREAGDAARSALTDPPNLPPGD